MQRETWDDTGFHSNSGWTLVDFRMWSILPWLVFLLLKQSIYACQIRIQIVSLTFRRSEIHGASGSRHWLTSASSVDELLRTFGSSTPSFCTTTSCSSSLSLNRHRRACNFVLGINPPYISSVKREILRALKRRRWQNCFVYHSSLQHSFPTFLNITKE